MRALKSLLLHGTTLFATATIASGASIIRRADSSACKLPAIQSVYFSSGFGYDYDCALSTGTLNALILFVDFPDQTATEASPQELYDRLITPAKQWLNTSSYGQLSLNITTDTTRFYRMPKNAADDNMVRPLQQRDHYLYVQDALEQWLLATNTPVPEVNSTDGSLTDVLYVIPTSNATGIELSAALTSGAYTYDVNYIAKKAVTMGIDTYDWWGYKALNHETGHTFCLPDLYPIPEGYTGQYTGNWDMMANVGASSPDYFAWNKWRLGWLSDNQIECILSSVGDTSSNSSTSTTHRLSPLETAGGVKAVIVKQGEKAALVAEVRSKNRNNADGCVTGFLLYTVATDLATGEGPIRVLDANPGWGSATCSIDDLDNAPLNFDGVSVSSYTAADWGITVTLVEQNGDDYTIRIDAA
ncbi:secreted protein [Colletotrichum incanum]|uniref:Secreted protein n=1 Tax=Colletotrichum incanum TaxID=1573173 RepID=A0A162PQ25_COLIC|nr:secreted protein [Colletotrichum incanum]